MKDWNTGMLEKTGNNNRNHKLGPPFSRALTPKELASLSDDDIDYSDIPELDSDYWSKAIGVPVGKGAISHMFLAARRDLVAGRSSGSDADSADDIDYSSLQPDAEFWREARWYNIDSSISRLISRRRLEAGIVGLDDVVPKRVSPLSYIRSFISSF